ncbi:LON peptidase substrate-binding domain-containing protein [Halioglobus sp. HI00S01]|uniref:LON peptidase substrate-binding domain-containing protein n=1 Tax=Halioglobus sp. HI00S01 TaxID=1822214 RepID=UPI000825A18E|nr:LON peptidase substrate-binding domain-containing protein [Halioglobus sp. HI00S01]
MSVAVSMPLFPLSAVLFPGGRMQLQIFEQRYLDLVRDSMKSGEPFGLVWIRQGSEVAQRGQASAALGDWGCSARIVDWDQLPNGLLGITIEGEERFDLHATQVRENDLVVGEVTLRPDPGPAPMDAQWQSMVDVLQSLEAHPHVQKLALSPDFCDAWSVGWTLAQLLPLEEHLKYQMLGYDQVELLMSELDRTLNEISGEG